MPVAPWRWCSLSYKFGVRSLLQQILACSLCCLSCPCFMPVSVPQTFLWRYLLRALLINLLGWSLSGTGSYVVRNISTLLFDYNSVFQSNALQLSCLSSLQFWFSARTFDLPLILSDVPRFFHLLRWLSMLMFKLTQSILDKKKNFLPPGQCSCMDLTPLKTRFLLSCWNHYLFVEILLIPLSRTHNKQY